MATDNSKPAGPGPQLVVLAAGVGRRYGGGKQTEAIGPFGEAIVEYSMYDALRQGFAEIIFVIRREMEHDFRASVGRFVEERARARYVFQSLDDLPAEFELPLHRSKPWGTGHALRCVRGAVDGPFAVINADDFYGGHCYRAMVDFLAQASEAGGRYGVVGFRLTDTLSDHGEVARGICEITRDGSLGGIVERARIRRFPEGVRYATLEGEWKEIPEESVVSMNMWGFTPDLFEHLEAELRVFLEREGTDPEAELYLPEVVGSLIRDGQVSVKVLRAEGQWFGLTNREDRIAARRSIRDLVEAGSYPSPLWGPRHAE
jgi:NDP-sugar pyrophosphorylase family protein